MKIDRLGNKITPKLRFFWGFSLIVPWLFLELSFLKALFLIFAAFYLLLAGKKIMWSRYLILTAGLFFFHLFFPYGKIIFRIGFFSLSEGSLHNALTKAVTLCGLMMISLFSINKKLQFKGSLSVLLSGMFFYFERLADYRSEICRKHKNTHGMISRLDEILTNLENETPENTNQENVKTSPEGIFLMLIPEIILWGQWYYENFI